MSTRLITAFPPSGTYYVSTRQSIPRSLNYTPWSRWQLVIAWGFSQYDSRPIPLTLQGAPDDDDYWRIKTPDGTVVEA